MKSARKSSLKNIVTRTAILFFVLLLLTGVFFLFVFRQELQRSGLSEAQVYASIYSLAIFMLVFILVLSVVVIIFALIFIEEFRIEFIKLISQLSGFDLSRRGDKIILDKNDELGEVAEKINNIVGSLESEIDKDTNIIAKEHKKFLDEQSLLAIEQKKIYEEQEKLNYVLSGINEGVIMLTRNRNIAVMNKAAQELTGFKQLEAAGKPINQIIKFIAPDQEIHPDEYAPMKETPGTKPAAFSRKNIRMETSQATPKNIDLLCAKLTLIQAQDYGFMLSLHDLSARSEIEKKTTNLLSSFASEISNPLNVISAGTQGENSKPESIQAALSQINITVENLIIAGKDDAEKLEVNLEDLQLEQIVSDSVAQIKPAADEKGIEVRIVIPNDASFKIKGDSGKLKVVILNLLINGLNFTLSGGTINLELSQSGDDFILQIQDTGIGIKTEDMQKLFSRFAVGENDKQITPGIGLGLFVSKKVIDAHGGKIWLDSVEGRGTIANISLPKAN